MNGLCISAHSFLILEPLFTFSLQEKPEADPCASVHVRRIHAVVLLAQLQPPLIAVNQALELLAVQLHGSAHTDTNAEDRCVFTTTTRFEMQSPCGCVWWVPGGGSGGAGPHRFTSCRTEQQLSIHIHTQQKLLLSGTYLRTWGSIGCG